MKGNSYYGELGDLYCELYCSSTAIMSALPPRHAVGVAVGSELGLALELAGGPDCIGLFARSTGILTGITTNMSSAALKLPRIRVTRKG